MVELEDAFEVGKGHFDLLRSWREVRIALVFARVRTQSRTGSSISRETLRAGALVQRGFNVQVVQSRTRAR